MTEACPIPTPEQRRVGEIHDRVVEEMLRAVYAAVQHAARQAQDEIAAAALDAPPPTHNYLMAIAHQKLYATLCGADPATLKGGNPAIALKIIRNSQNIARHYWGAEV